MRFYNLFIGENPEKAAANAAAREQFPAQRVREFERHLWRDEEDRVCVCGSRPCDIPFTRCVAYKPTRGNNCVYAVIYRPDHNERMKLGKHIKIGKNGIKKCVFINRGKPRKSVA